MEISIITALYNKLELTLEFWETLLQHPPVGRWEMIWIDDGSSDGTREWLRNIESAHATLGESHGSPQDSLGEQLRASPNPPCQIRSVFNEKNRGYAVNNNLGGKMAEGRILALLNNDLVLTSGWYRPMAQILESCKDAGCIGNVQQDARTGKLDHSGVFFYPRGRAMHDKSLPLEYGNCRKVVVTTAACILIQRELFLEMGGFDEGFRNGCEDVDLCLRLRKRGLNNYVALESRVRHYISSSPGRKDHDAFNDLRLMQRWMKEIPELMALGWQEIHLRDIWEDELRGWERKWAKHLGPRFYRKKEQVCPWWMRMGARRLFRKLYRESLSAGL